MVARGNVVYIRKFTHRHMGDFEINYNKEKKLFTCRLSKQETVTDPVDAMCEASARLMLDEMTQYTWAQVIVVSEEIGYSRIDSHDREHESSIQLKFKRLEMAPSLSKKDEWVYREHEDDLMAESLLSKERIESWKQGRTARQFWNKVTGEVRIPYTAELWSAMLEIEKMLEQQRELLGELLGRADVVDCLRFVAKYTKVIGDHAALPAPPKKRKAKR